MGSFFHGLSLIFPRLLDHTVEISLLICLIFLVKLLAPKKLPPWWHYSLWLLLLVRMMMPLEFENRLSLFGFVPSVETPHVSELISAPPQEVEMPAQPVVQKPRTMEADIRFAVKKSIPVIWLTGAMILGVCILFESITFWRNVRQRPRVTDEAILALLSECKSRMGISRKVDILVTDSVRCPALFGYLRPRLLLPEGVFDKLSDRELSYAFMHELGHLKRHDIGVSWLIAGLQVIHWFNPLVWLAFYQMRIDQESACDAAVLSRMKHRQSADYAKAIVGFLEKFCQNCQLPALAGVLENRSQMRKRIARIVQYRKSTQRLSFGAFILLVSAGFLLFSLTGVAAEKRMSEPFNQTVTPAPLETPGEGMEIGSAVAENISVGLYAWNREVTYQPEPGRDLPPTSQPETASAVPEDPVASLKREAPSGFATVSSEAAESDGSAENTEAAKTDTVQAETFAAQPSRVDAPEPIAATRSPVEFEAPALTTAASDAPTLVGDTQGAAFENMQAHTESATVQITAEQEQATAAGEPEQSPQVTADYAVEPEIQARNYAGLQTGGDTAYSADDIRQDVQGDTAPDSKVPKNDAKRADGLAVAGEMTQTSAGEMHPGSSTASMTAKPAAGGGSKVFQAGAVDTPPQLIKSYPPRYPYIAARDDISGFITVEFVVTKEGNAVGTTVVESDPKGVFDEAALNAIEQYRFKPGTKDGKAVDVKVSLPIKFNLT